MTGFTVVMLPAVISLGLWQVDRGAGKRAMEQAYLEQLTRLPVSVSQRDPQQRFQRLRLVGEYDAEQYFLLDNQIRDGEVGYWVLHVFHTTEGERYLLNRGFVAGHIERDRLPAVSVPRGQVGVVGVGWPFMGLIPVYDEDEWSVDWPKRVQRLDIDRMARVSAAQPLQIRLEPGQPGVDAAAPFAAVLSDAKHRGYAATWFGLAFALVVLFVAFGVRRAAMASNDGG